MAEARYAGLTYASISADRGAGGWQVHSRSPGLGGEDERLLIERVVTGFESHRGALPPFVEPEVLATLPVRFSAEPVPGGTIIRHAVQAGADATGRPGNVFTTVLLDRLAGTPPLPIRLWRSPDLRAPFGAAEVTAATPRWDVRPGNEVDAAAIASVVTDPDRWALLAVLLDAVAAGAAGGPTVVLRARDQDDAARWIGAVCLLTAPAWAAGLGWSLYERAEAVDGLRLRGVRLIVVPADDEPAADAEVVVLDADEQPALGVLGGTDHVTARGRRVPVTAWSDLVTELFPLEPGEVSRLIEEVAGDDAPTAGVGEPAWWLAAGLLGASSCPADLADAASAVLRRTAAPGALDQRHLELLAGVLGDGVQRTDDLRAALDRMDRDDARFELLAGRFVLAALADPDWLDAGTEGATPGGVVSGIDRDGIAAALREILVGADGSVLLRRLVAVLDVLRFAGALGAGDPRIDEPLVELVLTAAADLGAADAPVLVSLLNRLPAAVRGEVLPMVADGPLGGPGAIDAPQVVLPAELQPEQVLQLLDAADGGRLGIVAADALLARGPQRSVARRVGELLAARADTMGAVREVLHVDDWAVGDRRAVAAEQPDAVTRDQLVTAVAEGAQDDVRLLDEWIGLDQAVADTLDLRLRAEDAIAERRQRLDHPDESVLRAADRLAGGSAVPAAVVLDPRIRLLPVIALLIRRLGSTSVDSTFEALLRRRAFLRPLEPLPAAGVAVLADRLDRDLLTSALAYAASDRSSASDDALRRALRTEAGDLLDGAVAEVLPLIDPEASAAIVAAAEVLLADGSDASRLDRMLQRRASPVADYLEDHGLTLPRKVR